MITSDLKVSTLLNRYPAALDVMVSISPHFGKLKNKILRNTLAPRVTLEQAAKIAGIGVPDLLSRLNRELSMPPSCCAGESAEQEPASTRHSEPPAWMGTLRKENEVVLDVRPILASGVDPLKNIIETVRDLREGQYVRLVNFFEPVPLYEVLDKKGFDHWTEEKEGVYHVYLHGHWNAAAGEGPDGHAPECGGMEDHSGHSIVEVDVRGLEPPEPMVKVLEALSRIEKGGVLLVHHHREPLMLYEKLEERGFQAACQKIEENYFKVLIRKKS